MSHARWTRKFTAQNEKFLARVFLSEQTTGVFVSSLLWVDESFSPQVESFAATSSEEALSQVKDFLKSKYGDKFTFSEKS